MKIIVIPIEFFRFSNDSRYREERISRQTLTKCQMSLRRTYAESFWNIYKFHFVEIIPFLAFGIRILRDMTNISNHLIDDSK